MEPTRPRTTPPEDARDANADDAPSQGLQIDRRGFLQAAGFGLAAAATGCHRPPVRSARPYLEAPEHVVPGEALHYASVCDGCSAGCGTLVKVRDGRPIKLEGLDGKGLEGKGLDGRGLCARGQASLLGLYDSRRLRGPRLHGADATWKAADSAVREGLEAALRDGRKIRLLTPTLLGPTERAAVRRFADARGARHVEHDPVSASAILDAHQRTHGRRVLPRFRFAEAEVIVAVDADFLGTWISPVEHAAAYRDGRRPDADPPHMSYHVQIESLLTLSGSNADRRIALPPEEIGAAVATLASLLLRETDLAEADLEATPRGGASDLPDATRRALGELARELEQAGERGLLVCGSDDVDVQVLVNAMNQHLGAYGRTLDLERPSFQSRSDDGALAELMGELRAGEVGVLLVAGLDPAYLWEGRDLAEALRNVDLLAHLSPHDDATAALAGVVLPTPHFLESWGDAEPVDGRLGLRQPTIEPLYPSRSLRASLAAWTADDAPSKPSLEADLDALREHWRREIHPRDPQSRPFREFWDRTLHDGFVELPPAGDQRPESPDRPDSTREEIAPVLSRVLSRPRDRRAAREDGAFTLVLHPTVGLGDGRHADNPWLQELPDPIAKTTWGNHAALAPATAAGLGVISGDVVRLEAGDVVIELPVLVQPGQHSSVVAVAMGGGDPRSERFRDVHPPWIQARPSTGDDGRVGVNGARLVQAPSLLRFGVRVVPTGERDELARTQTFHSLDLPPETAPPGAERRPFVETVEFAALGGAANASPNGAPHGDDTEHGAHGEDHHDADLYPQNHPNDEGSGDAPHRWGMTIDLEACTGCSACVVACQAENNLPVVGRDEVRRRREMHWLRIDRYYGESADADEGKVDVAFQPMLCQHCDQAPCETVCPVLATVQTEEGLNAQAYNRCVGTRYCANNCPFKIRRFNWFDYRRDDPVANLVLNPDVVVRSRGVMEKCTFCVQRLESAKVAARRRAREAGDTFAGARVRDEEVQTACQQSCPADAIVLGDMLDPESRVAEIRRSRRSYRLLEELAVAPSVDYLQRVERPPPLGDGPDRATAEEDDHA